MSAAAPRRPVLVIKLGALGDVVLALPYIAAIRAACPGQAVTLLTAPEYAALAAAVPDIEVVAFPRRGFRAMARLLTWLAGRRFGAVYDLQGSLRSRIMTLASRAGRRVGVRPSRVYNRCPAEDLPGHAAARLDGLLAAAGIAAPAPGWRLAAGAAAEARVDRWLQAHGLPGHPLVLLHAGGSPRWPSKRWPAAHFRELATTLAGRGWQVVWLGGPDEAGLNRALAASVGTDAGGAFDHLELAALARHARFAVSNDSGPMHVLAAAGLPVYACFGPTDWRRSHAPGQAGRVLTRALSCSPCHLPVCPPQRGHACLRELPPATVLARLEADGLLNPPQ